MMRHYGLFCLALVAVFAVGFSATVKRNVMDDLPYAIRCDSGFCAYDLRPWCLESGRTVYGHCDLQNAICKDGEKLASSGPC